MIRQHIPLERAHEAVAVLFDAPLSEGTLAGLSVDAAERLAPFMAELAALIRSSAVVCADETSTKVGRSTSWVTGASCGMGLATAHAFAAAGAAVVLADVDEQAVRAATDEIVGKGQQALAVVCDVSDEAQVANMADLAVAEFGRLDAAFNNAGIMIPPSDAADEPVERFERVVAVNLRGVWACMKHELRHMRTQGSGAIVNCSSLGGLVGLPGRASYHATKHGVIGMTKSVALEYASRGVRVNAICPGTIDTPMVRRMIDSGELDEAEAMKNQPIARLGRADEMAACVLWLCSPGASFVVGVALPVDGGYTAQ